MSGARADYEAVVGLSGTAHDLYAWGPERALVGQGVDELALGPGGGLTAVVELPSSAEAYDPGGAVVPAVIEGTLRKPDGVTWVAVSLNGTVAGVGPVSIAEPGRFSVLVDPALLQPGRNQVQVWAVTSDGLKAVRANP